MKKTSLIILLLIAVIFCMTSCNGSTSSPSSNDSNSNSIPGVKEDPNVPNSSEFVNSDPNAAAKASDVLSSLESVVTSSTAIVHHYEYSEIIKFSAIENANINGNAVTGSLELKRNIIEDYNSSSREGTNYPRVWTEFYNGEVKIGEDKYKAVNFEVKYTQDAEGNRSTPVYSGKLLKNDSDIQDPQSVLSLIPVFNPDVFKREFVSRSVLFNNSYADSKLTGDVGYKMNMTEENKGHQIMAINFTNIEGGHSLTAKLSYDFETTEAGYKPSNIKFDYLSLDGTYYTPEFALTIEPIVELLTHIG